MAQSTVTTTLCLIVYMIVSPQEDSSEVMKSGDSNL